MKPVSPEVQVVITKSYHTFEEQLKIRNVGFRIAEDKDRPFFVVKETSRYSTIEYDFITVSMVLKQAVVDDLKKWGNQYEHYFKPGVKGIGGRNYFVPIAGQITVRNDIAGEVTLHLRNVVLNPKNWSYPIYGKDRF